MATVDYNALFIISSVTLGVVLSLWVGMRFMIRIDRNLKKTLEKINKMEAEQLKLDNKIIKMELLSIKKKPTKKTTTRKKKSKKKRK